MRRLGVAAILLGSALAFVGCGDGGGGTTNPPPPATGGGGGGGGGGGKSDGGVTQTFEMSITNFAFAPAQLTVTPGSTVIVHNQDTVPHSVTSEQAIGYYSPGAVNGVSFDTGPFTGDASFTIPASAPQGTVVPYFCSVHTGMMPEGSITIQ